MSREWKPGELALVSSWRGADLPAFRMRRDDYGNVWCVLHAGDRCGLKDIEVGDNARPLVVIDPEDREAVERLMTLYVGAPLEDDEFRGLSGSASFRRESANALQQALREFANPKPPKPEEPTGLGAVVEDVAGRRWVRLVRAGDDSTPDDWKRSGYHGTGADDEWCRYADIDAVRVLSEGVHS